MKKFLLIVFFLGFSYFLQGQNMPPAYEVKTDTLEWDELNSKYWQMLGDKNGSWTIEQVTGHPLANDFHDQAKQQTGADVNTYWIRYRLKNIMLGEANVSLNSISEYDDFYVSGNDGKWRHYVSGRFNQWDKKDGFKKNDCIPVTLQPSEEIIVYQRISNRDPGLPADFAVAVVSTKKIIDSYIDFVHSGQSIYSARELQEMFLVGVIFLAIFINLFFYRIVREKEYLYFSLFLLSLGIDRLINFIGIYLSWQYPDLHDYYGYINLSWIFILFFLVQFVRSFFKISLRYPAWDKFLLVTGIIAGVFNFTATFFISPGFMLGPTSYPLTYLIYSIMISIICISLLISFLFYAGQKKSFANLVIIGGSPLMLVWGVVILFYSVPFFANIEYGYHIPHWIFVVLTPFRLVEVTCTTWFAVFFSLILFRRFNHLRKENAQQALDKERLAKEKEIERNLLIEQQKKELEKQVFERTSELQKSLEELKATQSQLIQSEKMASLGELTAGIAHEIQNPLNFVNNFSEVNTELIDELEQEINKGNIDDAKAIAKDIKENEQKINHHGKRADAIVKGMLQHSRSSSGQKEPTDINALADEYLRLAYHGLRAKDKSFNATMKTDFDPSIGKINIIPQDIGRVILNLITNAFYAVAEKKKNGSPGYEPTVSVSTMRSLSGGEGRGEAIIKVTDNGNGIPQKVLGKIFQPFFTTKPTGQGTGLGLSLSYDIVKAHGGELKVETMEDYGTTFIIQLPLI